MAIVVQWRQVKEVTNLSSQMERGSFGQFRSKNSEEAQAYRVKSSDPVQLATRTCELAEFTVGPTLQDDIATDRSVHIEPQREPLIQRSRLYWHAQDDLHHGRQIYTIGRLKECSKTCNGAVDSTTKEKNNLQSWRNIYEDTKMRVSSR